MLIRLWQAARGVGKDRGQIKHSGGSADPSRRFREQEISEEERQQVEKERERRLDPDNRPEMAEVDNTHRDFDPEKGEFVDE